MTWLLPLALLGCGSRTPPPDVFLITVDTLRADHVGAYGHERAQTPWMDALAAEGVVYEHAISTASWTVPGATATLLSAYPWQLGLTESTKVDSARPVLPAEAVGLAQVLHDKGYWTLGFAANGHLAEERGYGRGFDVFENVGFGDRHELGEAMKPWMDGIATRERPVFVWIHVFDPHEPYAGGLRHADRIAPGTSERLGEPRLDRMLMKGLRADPRLAAPGPGLDTLEALYDGEIAATDAFLKRITEALRVGEDDIVLLASDHGEEFLEHGRLGHHGDLWAETTRVPLILRAPGLAPARRQELVSLVDVPATLLAAAGVTAPETWVGQDLRGDVDGPRFMELDERQAVVHGEWKWLRDAEGERLFRGSDEHTDLAATEPTKLAELRGLWDARDLPVWEPQAGEVDEQIELLEGMGYLHRDP